MKKILIVFGAILAAALIAAAGFWGGMTYQSNQVDRVRAAFESARGPLTEGQIPGEGRAFPAGGQPGLGGGFMGGAGTNGVVKSIEGNVITISTAQNVTTVNLSDATRIQKSVTGSIADLQPGMRVMVSGEADDDGVITATQVTILNEDAPAFPDPSGMDKEP